MTERDTRPRVGYSTEPGLIAKFRVPLDGKTAAMLAALVIQYPAHSLAVEGSFLAMRECVIPTAADWDTAFPPIRPHTCHIELGALYAGQRDPDCAGCRCIPPAESEETR